MKTLRFIGVALLTVLLSVSFSACGSDDEGGGSDPSASIEGTWYLKSEQWFTDETRQTVSSQTTYPDYSTERIWMFAYSGSTLLFAQTKDGDLTKTKEPLIVNGTNDYQKGNDRFVVKSVTAKQLVVDYYDNYYSDNEKYKEYGTYTFMR